MNWISVKDKLPPTPAIIVAIMGGRHEQGGDPIEDALIVILRSMWEGDEWRTMDCTDIFHLPNDQKDYYKTIHYWMSWKDFKFPESMIIKGD